MNKNASTASDKSLDLASYASTEECFVVESVVSRYDESKDLNDKALVKISKKVVI